MVIEFKRTFNAYYQEAQTIVICKEMIVPEIRNFQKVYKTDSW